MQRRRRLDRRAGRVAPAAGGTCDVPRRSFNVAGRLALAAFATGENPGAAGELASLREDYLSQVQRVYLSRRIHGNTPSELHRYRRAQILIEDRRFDAQHLVQLGTGGRVLQMDLLVREDEGRGGE